MQQPVDRRTSILRVVLVSVVVASIALVAIGAPFTGNHDVEAASDPLWVNDLGYGSLGGGFYWDPTSGTVWTAERGWHLFSPIPRRSEPTTFWVNHLTYGSKGGGFYWDSVSGTVWTAERGWHLHDPRPNGTPPAPPTPPAGTTSTFGAGTKLVGTEIKAATYRTRVASESCYWERLSGLGGELDDIIANDNTDGPAVVTIASTDVAFDSRRCGQWTTDLSAITTSPTAPFPGNGTFIVGTDIAPGTWRSTGGSTCYWQRMRSFTGDLDDIIANDNADGAIVTINASDKGFSSSRCGTWTRVN